ncbi:MAG: hypothetical protein PHQ05_03875 [Sterolibacterium sp.]|nr:hypothetical protein [Sterolibacterium sp.]
MIDRRQFFNAVAVILAGVLVPGKRLMRYDAIGNGATTPPTMVVYDERIPASCAFARSVSRAGIRAIESRGDVGELWHNAMRPALQRVPHRLIGLTLASDIFLLKLLAADAGMKVWHEVPSASSGNLVFWGIADKVDEAGESLAALCSDLLVA